ncbi:hypothetical protein RclHR1_00480003 [Rhizophagus clarus]|uniref:Uncharacterized protein n=1 Tax=Rhizophagus clarus TaxID=94130 RepID=A0A2Z6RJA6_9GLOM|nr:hypothetical protein RclHR1_00480003 [Rhizophagus clarus]GET00447.1 hypothetical protein GLOIN_2v1768207 [Rhizophagus clarus]
MDETCIKIDIEIDIDVTDGTNEDKINDYKLPHNGRPITKMEVLPNKKYLVTYCDIVKMTIRLSIGML